MFRVVSCRFSQKSDAPTADAPCLGEVRDTITFSLTDISGMPSAGRAGGGHGASSKWACGAPSRRGGRHLRQIEDISCTADGQYAIIRCSDNAVLLYRWVIMLLSSSLACGYYSNVFYEISDCFVVPVWSIYLGLDVCLYALRSAVSPDRVRLLQTQTPSHATALSKKDAGPLASLLSGTKPTTTSD